MHYSTHTSSASTLCGVCQGVSLASGTSIWRYDSLSYIIFLKRILFDILNTEVHRHCMITSEKPILEQTIKLAWICNSLQLLSCCYKGFTLRARGTRIAQETPEKEVWRLQLGTGAHLDHTLAGLQYFERTYV